MCGIEILLCCAAGAGAGCYSRHKLGGGKKDKKGKAKAQKGRLDEHETYRKNPSAAAEKKAAKQRKHTSSPERPQPRLTAYEQYQLRAQEAERKQRERLQAQPHRREPLATCNNLMDADEFSRLQKHWQQQREKGAWGLVGRNSY